MARLNRVTLGSMVVLVEFYDPEQLETKDPCPFNKKYRSDNWILYHGTSNLSEERIESDGFSGKSPLFSLEEIRRVCAIFKKLGWGGSPEGYSILGSFAQFDFDNVGSDAATSISFSEISWQACLYASPERIGGEAATGMRNALDHIQKFILDRAIQQDHLWYISNELVQHPALKGVDVGASVTHPMKKEAVAYEQYLELHKLCSTKAQIGPPLPEPSGEWLREAVGACDELVERAEAQRRNYQYGCVYAVRFCESDVDSMGEDNAGPWVNTIIPPDRIVAKAILPPEAFPTEVSDFFYMKGYGPDDLRIELRHRTENGIMRALSRKSQGSKTRPQ